MRQISFTGWTTVALVVASLTPAQAAPGGSAEVGVGTLESNGTATGTVYDTSTKREYNFGLRADERTNDSGRGDVAFNLFGHRISLCTVHGSEALVDFSNEGGEGPAAPLPDPEDPSSDPQPAAPLTRECGRAGSQSVAVDGCTATIEAHGYLHSDHPFDPFLGAVLLDIKFTKTGPNSGRLDATARFANEMIKIQGPTTGAVVMPTCP